MHVVHGARQRFQHLHRLGRFLFEPAQARPEALDIGPQQPQPVAQTAQRRRAITAPLINRARQRVLVGVELHQSIVDLTQILSVGLLRFSEPGFGTLRQFNCLLRGAAGRFFDGGQPLLEHFEVARHVFIAALDGGRQSVHAVGHRRQDGNSDLAALTLKLALNAIGQTRRRGFEFGKKRGVRILGAAAFSGQLLIERFKPFGKRRGGIAVAR